MVQAAPRARSRVALLVGGRCRDSPRLAEPQPRRIEATRGQGSCPKVSGGRRAAAGRPPSLNTRPCLAQSATGSLPRRRGATAHVPYQGAAAASYAPGWQPARHTCHRDPARPAHSASTPRGPPRYSGGCRGYPAGLAAAGGGRGRSIASEAGRSISRPIEGRRAARVRKNAYHSALGQADLGARFDWARRDLGCCGPQHARGLPWARVWAAPAGLEAEAPTPPACLPHLPPHQAPDGRYSRYPSRYASR